jgi:CelD/BcsL family acetyltransferase involved in cellulose biosynthesis
MPATHSTAAITDIGPDCEFEFSVARTIGAVQQLAREWNELHSASEPQNPFLSYYWASGCLAHVHGRSVPFVVSARHRGTLVGLLPLHLRRRGPFRVLRFIGDGRSDYLGVLRRRDCPTVTAALIRELSRMHDEWDLAFLRRISPAYGDMLSVVPEGLECMWVEGDVAPHLSSGAAWDELLRSGPSQLRHTQRWMRKFEREGGAVVCLTGGAAAGLLAELAAVEAHSWKARCGLGWFFDPANHRLLSEALTATDAIQVWIARFQGQAIAFLVNFVTTERVMYYQGAYREEFRRYYPGGILHFHAIRAAWQSGLREYDFLIGNEEYKSGWSTGTHPQRYVSLFPNTPRGRLAFAAIVAPRWYLRRFRSAHAVYEVWRRRSRLWSQSVRWRLLPAGILRPNEPARGEGAAE